jgi:hypothetical protein
VGRSTFRVIYQMDVEISSRVETYHLNFSGREKNRSSG